jgi:hypothetical protein
MGGTIMKRFVVRTRWGTVRVVIAITVATPIMDRWGTIYGIYGWRQVVAGLMISEGLLFAGVLKATRPPNPYKRISHLYDRRDLGPTGMLGSDGLRWL